MHEHDVWVGDTEPGWQQVVIGNVRHQKTSVAFACIVISPWATLARQAADKINVGAARAPQSIPQN